MIKWKYVNASNNQKAYAVEYNGAYLTLSQLSKLFDGCYYEILYSRFTKHVLKDSDKFNTVEEFADTSRENKTYKRKGKPAKKVKFVRDIKKDSAIEELSNIMNDDFLFMRDESGPRIKELQQIIHG